MKLNNKGFSLIELSIVLIIIGLLVAGVTGGASLIKSAELRAVMSEIRNYQTAVNAYYTATGNLPGTVGSTMDFGDSGVAWKDLADEGITDQEPTTTTAVTTITSAVGLKSKNKGSYYVLGYNDSMQANVIMLAAGSTDTPDTLRTAESESTANKVTNASITSKDAKFLDDKMDNGIIDSGRVQSFNTDAGTCSYASANYDLSCATAVKIGLDY